MDDNERNETGERSVGGNVGCDHLGEGFWKMIKIHVNGKEDYSRVAIWGGKQVRWSRYRTYLTYLGILLNICTEYCKPETARNPRANHTNRPNLHHCMPSRAWICTPSHEPWTWQEYRGSMTLNGDTELTWQVEYQILLVQSQGRWESMSNIRKG